MPFPEWRDWTKEADTNKIGPTDAHYYLTTGAFAFACCGAPEEAFISAGGGRGQGQAGLLTPVVV